MEDPPLELPLLSESKLSDAVTGGHLACNPAIDLVATVGDGSLNLWRPRGQQVSRLVERDQRVDALRWKEDGLFLAAGWSDGVVRLMGLENTKAVHYIRLSDAGPARISHIAWSRNYIGRRAPKGSSRPANSWDKLLSGGLDLEENRDLLDLPHELTFLEVDTALPKISPLPVSGGSGDDMFVFSTRTSLDFVFRPLKPEDTDTVDVMLVGTKDGNIHLSIYDSFVIGHFRPGLPDNAAASGELELCCHASNPDISTHSLLLRPQGDADRHAVYLIPMDLTFIHSSSANLSLLASKTTTLQNLLRYIKQTQVHMVSEWKSTRELPNRFLLGVQEDLEKMPNGPVSIIQALYHTVVTGHVFKPVQEWLVDSLAERGHKRWDKAVVSGLESLRSLVHENMIPALERSAIILSRLLGIARFHGTKDNIGFSAAQITKLMDIVSCLTLVSHKILLLVMEELHLFTTFSYWLRYEIDKLASPSTSDEISEKEATLDNVKVLTYIQQYLTTSPLALYLDQVERDVYTDDWQHAEDGSSLLEMLDKQLQRQEAGRPFMRALPHVDFLVNYLTSRANIVFGSIAESQKRSVRLGRETRLEIGNDISKYDVRMCTERRPDHLDGLTFTAVASEKAQSEVFIFCTSIEIINGISSAVSTSVAGLSLAGGRMIDFKFLNDSSLLLLWTAQKPDSSPVLLNVPFQSLPYTAYENNSVPEPLRVDENDISHVFSAATFGKLPAFTPIQMQVIGASSSRGEMPARVCLLGRDRAMYKVFTLPEKWEPRMQLAVQEDVSMG